MNHSTGGAAPAVMAQTPQTQRSPHLFDFEAPDQNPQLNDSQLIEDDIRRSINVIQTANSDVMKERLSQAQQISRQIVQGRKNQRGLRKSPHRHSDDQIDTMGSGKATFNSQCDNQLQSSVKQRVRRDFDSNSCQDWPQQYRNKKANQSPQPYRRGIQHRPSAMKLEGGSIDDADQSIDDIFPQTIRRFTRYNPELDHQLDETENQSSINKSDVNPQEQTCLRQIALLLYCIVWPFYWVLYHLFCCCFCDEKSQRRFKTPPQADKIQFLAQLKSQFNKKHSEESRVMGSMVKLLKKSPTAYQNLQCIRVNPQLNRILAARDESKSKKNNVKLRCDLEFYIPQLIAHYLRSDIDKKESKKMKALIIESSKLSLFFAHRIWFYLKASSCGNSATQEGKEHLSKIASLQTLMEIEINKHQKELLYIAQSDSLLKMMMKSSTDQVLLNAESFAMVKKWQHLDSNKKQNFFARIFNKDKQRRNSENHQQKPVEVEMAADNEQQRSLLDNDSLGNMNTNIPSQARDPEAQSIIPRRNSDIDSLPEIIAQQFSVKFYPYQSTLASEDGQSQAFVSTGQLETGLEAANQPFSQKAFMSTPNFMKDLTDTCEQVLEVKDDKMKFLTAQMHKINRSLPATAYIPILTGAQRNFMVLKVVPEDCRLFITATKAPYLVNIEVFSPQELNQFISTVQAQHKPRAFDLMRNLKMVNEDHNKMNKKIITELSKPIYPFQDKQKTKSSKTKEILNNGNEEAKDHENEFEIRKTVNYAKLIDQNKKDNRSIKDEVTELNSVDPTNVDLLGLGNGIQRSPSVVQGPDKSDLDISIDKIDLDANNMKVIDVEGELERLSIQRQSVQCSNDPSYAQRQSQIPDHYGFYQNQESVIYQKDIIENNSAISEHSLAYNDAAFIQQSQQLGNINFTPKQEVGIRKNQQQMMGRMTPQMSYVESQRNDSQADSGDNVLFNQIFPGEMAEDQEKRIKDQSMFKHLKSWRLLRMIVKSNDDLRSEQFAMQIIETIDLIFKKRRLKLKLKPYEILSTGLDCGIVEFLPDAYSIDYIKRKMKEKTGKDMDLVDFYHMRFGNTNSNAHKQAVKNLADSLAAYSLVCYILQIKDRHNGNILISVKDGSLIHIDFGFILASRLLNFEMAPFKISGDVIRLLGGPKGEGFCRFRARMIDGYQALHEDNEKILILVKMIAQSQKELPCFKRGVDDAVNELRHRLTPKGPNVRLTRQECEEEVDKIITDAYNAWTTRIYDQYQYCCQGVFF